MDTLYNETVAAITARAESQGGQGTCAALAPLSSSRTAGDSSSLVGERQSATTPSTQASGGSDTASSDSGTALVAAVTGSTGGTTAVDVVRDPVTYAVQLAEAVTGEQVQLQGYSPVMDALLRLSPPAALTPEGITKAHQEVGLGGGWDVEDSHLLTSRGSQYALRDQHL